MMLNKFLSRTEYSSYDDLYKNFKISIPENHLDLEKSKAMAAEREEYVKTIDGLVQKWEELLEEQDMLEQEDK